jgi:hypothetical protein
MSNENKNNNENIEQQTTSKHWWKKLLVLTPTYSYNLLLFISFVVIFIIISFDLQEGFHMYNNYILKKYSM